MKTTLKAIIALLLIASIGCQKESVKTSAVSQSNSSNAVAAFQIGQHYNGGTIFYINSTGQHGLIASVTDLSTEAAWNNGYNIVTGATGVTVGSGRSNTEKIVVAQGKTVGYAALLCWQYRSEGFGNWYLPSKRELDLLYQQRAVLGMPDQYWSSSEVSRGKAWDQEFGGGFQFKDTKSFTLNVRAISSF